MTYDEPFEGDGLRYELEYFMNKANGKTDDRFDEQIKSISCAMAGCMEKFLDRR